MVAEGPVSSAFVGRRAELAALLEAAERVAGGEPNFVLVGGEAGVGKSRLVAEAAARPELAGFRLLRGQCVELGAEALAFAPLVDALRTLARTTGAAELDGFLGPARGELARLLPDFAPRSWTAAPSLPAGLAQLLELVLGVIDRVSAATPLLLVIEDLHWGDRSTLDLVAFLVRSLHGARVLLVLTYRSDELPRRHPLRSLLSGWGQVRSMRRVELRGFDHDEVAEQVGAILGVPPDRQFVGQLLDRSEGNPFLVEEILAAVRAGGDSNELPASLRDVLLARFDLLSPPARQLLRAVSAAGHQVPDRLLAAVAGLDERALLSLVREGVEHHVLVVEESGTGYAFRHALARSAVYDDMLPGERMALHAAFADAISSDPGLIGAAATVPAALALHWYAALDLPRALGASVEAGRRAATYAPAEAQRHFEQALEIWTRVADAEQLAGLDQVEVIRLAAEAAFQAGAVIRALSLLDQALSALQPTADPVRRARLLERRGRALRGLGRDAEAIAALRQALALLAEDHTTAAYAVVLTSLASALMHVADFAAARETAQRAVSAARARSAGEQEADALITLGTARAYAGDGAGGLSALRAGLSRAVDLDVAETALRGHVNISDVLEMLGWHEEAAEAARIGMALARRAGFTRTMGAYLAGNLVESLIRLGRWAQAESVAVDTLDGGLEGVFASTLIQMRGELAAGAGRYDDATEFVRQAGQLVAETADDQVLQPLAYIDAEVSRARGDLTAAREIVTSAVGSEATGAGRYAWPLVWLGMRTEADLATSARDRRQSVSPVVMTRAAELGRLAAALPALTPSAHAYNATVAAEQVRVADGPAAATWSTAALAWRRAREPHLLAYALLRFATAALADGDRDTPARAVREAAGIARELGAVPLAEEAAALARRARIDIDIHPGGNVTEDRPFALQPIDELARFGLTEREREVLALIAAGRSNAQIGAELFISPKTASVHVSRILAKLGVTGRGEAAALAHRLGLLSDQGGGEPPQPGGAGAR